MLRLLASAYGSDVYNNPQVYASTTEIADSGVGAAGGAGDLADTGIFAVVFIVVGVSIIAMTILAQYRRRQISLVSR